MIQDVTLTMGVCKSNLIQKVHFLFSSKMYMLILSVVKVSLINLMAYKISEEKSPGTPVRDVLSFWACL